VTGPSRTKLLAAGYWWQWQKTSFRQNGSSNMGAIRRGTGERVPHLFRRYEYNMPHFSL